MEAFDFDGFQNVFVDTLREHAEIFEEGAQELGKRADCLKVLVEKCEPLTEIIVEKGDEKEFNISRLDKFIISGKSSANYRVFNDAIHNELVIDLAHTPALYENPCSAPLSYLRIDSEIIYHGSIYLIGSYFITAYKEYSNSGSVLKLEIGKSLNQSEVAYSLSLTNNGKISLRNKAFDSIIIGRNMSENTIHLQEPQISRIHAEIHFNSPYWEIQDKSRYGVWKALHTIRSIQSQTESKKHLLTSNFRVKFNGIVFDISPVFSNN